MENVKYIIAKKWGINHAISNLMIFDYPINQNIRHKVTDDKILSMRKKTKDVLINVEYTIYDKH